MEIVGLLIMDTRKAWVTLDFQYVLALDLCHLYSRFGEECALVRLCLTSYDCKTDIINVAPRS